MNTLTLRIYVTVVATLLLFATMSTWLFQRQIDQERSRADAVLSDRMAAWGDLIQRSLPGDEAPFDDQAAALKEWSERLRIPLALDSADGRRIGTSESFERRAAEGGRVFSVKLEDGRILLLQRSGRSSQSQMRRSSGSPNNPGFDRRGGMDLPFLPPGWSRGAGWVVLLVGLFVAVSVGALPVVRRLTRRLKALQRSVEVFGAGDLSHRVRVTGSDEVTSLATSFNAAATRIEALVRSHQSLLANASHELRSPLARMKMAVAMLDDAAPAYRDKLRKEIATNIAELDGLVEEVLLASRLDALNDLEQTGRVDLLGLAAEEAARVGAVVSGDELVVTGDERLLRRALRNLLENAKRYGAGGEIEVAIAREDGTARICVNDRGPGVPDAQAERIFEPFYRMPGHAEVAGGVGLGLSLVKQIAERHGGSVRCLAREGGGSTFELQLHSARVGEQHAG